MADRFEYRFIVVKWEREHEIESVLNGLGREGWEVTSHAVVASSYTVILKRAVG